MVLTIFIMLAWLLTMILIFLPKPFSFTENSFLFLTTSILIKNTFTIVGFNLKWIERSEQSDFFVAYFLYRTLLYPLALLIMINLFYLYKKNIHKVLTILSAGIFIFAVEILGERLEVYSYKQWNNWYTLVEIILFIILTFLFAKLIRHFELRKTKYDHL
ncbi:hypothetical protein JOC85_003852 [Bacillus mesophilus]|uniref:Uncharacterized protein n=1 Tax=Bacillus mesophilus TaxID=1808955 RepID=A0A6M0QBE9_9BACI|nr:hypothetical protein [Bacillus mesophilus]MBM7663026.1 hypothetical protein [Bacillus mesophilus]NEY73653.1 hypothetical protein [Bacillus mesophilus]